MSGLQEIAAIIGVAEVSFRSICSLYEFFKDLKNVPKEIEAIRGETFALQQCLSELRYLQDVDEKIHAAVRRTGLSQAVTNCGEACAKLYELLYKWAATSKYNLLDRIQFRWDRKVINNVITQISNVKQTAILSVVVTQMSMQSSSSSCNIGRKRLPDEQKQNTSSTRLPAMSEKQTNPSSNPTGNQAALFDNPSTTNAVQSFKGKVEVGGSENSVGMSKEVATAVQHTKQIFYKKVSTRDGSSGNKIGIF